MTMTPDQIWTKTLDVLKQKMTGATHRELFVQSRSSLLSANGKYVVQVNTDEVRERLEYRLAGVIAQSLGQVIEHQVTAEQLEFVIPDVAEPPPLEQPVVSEKDLCRFPDSGLDFASIDYKRLYYVKTGYLPVAHYHTTFWQAFMGLFNTQAFNLWLALQKYDKRHIFKGDLDTWWTPPQKISLRELAGMVGGSKGTLTGRLVPCWGYERSKDQGQPWAQCCGKFTPAVWSPPDAPPPQRRCRHWKKGAIELLQELKIMLVEVNDAPAARSRSFRFQVWRLLPLLTPNQVEQLPLILQLRHDQWLNEYGYLADFTLDDWAQIDNDALVEGIPSYYSGQQITDNYRPNPFLSSRDKKNEQLP